MASTGQQWSQPEQYAAMASTTNDDFEALLDFENFENLEFLNMNNFDLNDASGKPSNIDPSLFTSAPQQQHSIQTPHTQSVAPEPNMFDMDMQMVFNAHQGQSFAMPGAHQMGHHPIIPITPNSIEMHPDGARYMQHFAAQSRAIIEQGYQLRRADTVSIGFSGKDTRH
jgi:hypothetical protein